jgi:hypothetical protein
VNKPKNKLKSLLVRKMTPEGPYHSPYSGTNRGLYLIQTVWQGQIVYATVFQGDQPDSSDIYPNRSAAIEWLRNNGYELSEHGKRRANRRDPNEGY